MNRGALAAIALLCSIAAGAACSANDAAKAVVPDELPAPRESGGADASATNDAAPPAPASDAATRDASAVDATVPDCGAFAPATNLDANGSYATTSALEGPGCTIVRPKVLGDGGVRHPVIIWGNGTDAPTTVYQGAFDFWASHGFVVAAANAINGQGAGAPLLACLDYVLAENAKPGSAYEGKICPRVAATGHSQGGAGAIMAGRDARVSVTAPLMAYTRQGWGGFDTSSITAQKASPMLLLSGTADDNAVPDVYQEPVFQTTNVPVFWANLIGGNHYTTALGLPTYRAVMLAWFRFHLMDDQTVRGTFYGSSCALCGDSAHWIVQRNGAF